MLVKTLLVLSLASVSAQFSNPFWENSRGCDSADTKICIGKCEVICTNGKPCGNSCIAKDKECKTMGTGKACVPRSMATRVCSTGKPCGDACISMEKKCNTPAGTAVWAETKEEL